MQMTSLWIHNIKTQAGHGWFMSYSLSSSINGESPVLLWTFNDSSSFFDDGESPTLLCIFDDPLQLQISVDDAVAVDVCCGHCLLCFAVGELHANARHGLFQLCSVLDITPSPLVSMPSSHSQYSFTVIFFSGFVWWMAPLPFVWTRNVRDFIERNKSRG